MRSRATKRPVKKSYRVRRAVDNSMRYFDASYLLGKNDDDDNNDNDADNNDLKDGANDPSRPAHAKSSSTNDAQATTTTVPQHGDRRARFKYDSAAVDDVTNVRSTDLYILWSELSWRKHRHKLPSVGFRS